MAYKFQMGTFKPSGSIQITDSYGLSGSGKAEIAGNLSVGNGGAYGLTSAGAATIASMAGNWTNAGRTVADAGILTTVDINGGTIDGTAIGASSQSTAKFTTVSGSGAATFAGQVSGSSFFVHNGKGLWDGDGLALAGTGELELGSDGAVSASSNVSIAGNLKVGNGGAYGLTSAGAATIASMAGNWTNAGRTVADMGIVTTMDLNGGSIDGTVIGANSAAAVNGTDLSASNYVYGNTAKFGGINFAGKNATGGVVTSDSGVILFGASADQELRSGVISGSSNLTIAGNLKVGNGGAYGVTSAGAATLGATTATTVSASSTVQMAGNLSVGGSGYGLTTAGAATIASMAGNWTNAGRTVADAGILTTVDINGGSIDGTVIGANSAADVTATDLILGASSGVLYLSGDGGAEKISCNSGNNVNINAGGDVIFNPGGLNLLPENDDTIDLGSSAKQWKDLYVDGVGYIDQLGASGDGAVVYATNISASGKLEVAGNAVIAGNLLVEGTTTFIETTNMLVTDKNILIASGSANAAAAAGAGLTVATSADASSNLQWVYKQNGEGDAASSGDIWMASGSSGLFDIQCENLYGNVTGDIVNGVQGIGNAAGTLETGFNYGTTKFTATRVWTLPTSPTVGQVVYVKAPEELQGYSIRVSGAGAHRIDGEEFVDINSDFGAANFVYAAANVWRVF